MGPFHFSSEFITPPIPLPPHQDGDGQNQQSPGWGRSVRSCKAAAPVTVSSLGEILSSVCNWQAPPHACIPGEACQVTRTIPAVPCDHQEGGKPFLRVSEWRFQGRRPCRSKLEMLGEAHLVQAMGADCGCCTDPACPLFCSICHCSGEGRGAPPVTTPLTPLTSWVSGLSLSPFSLCCPAPRAPCAVLSVSLSL